MTHSVILIDLLNQYCEAFGVLRHWAPSGKSAGFHGGQAGAKKSQNYSQTFNASLHSMKTSWLSRGISMPLHSKGYMALY